MAFAQAILAFLTTVVLETAEHHWSVLIFIIELVADWAFVLRRELVELWFCFHS
jgi:hypothetical protein